MSTAPDQTPFSTLDPDSVLDAVESLGFECDGRLLALNSYENRVYQVGLESDTPLVAKFYRPDRWSDEAILEEHAFSLELAGAEIPVIPPMIRNKLSLHHFENHRFAVFERRGGRWPELTDPDTRLWLGRFLGRIHMVGEASDYETRPVLSVEEFGDNARNTLLEQNWIPPHLEEAYDSVTVDLLDGVDQRIAEAGEMSFIRLHGDCHPGNILWTPDGPHFVDLDDSRMGPAVQDLWMLLSGDREEMTVQLADLLEGYNEFANFDPRELWLIEALRSLRMIHYAAWLARRWNDPAFPLAFPWFNTTRYWEDHVLSLREQLGEIHEPPLPWRAK
jgi:Ser/Thr protein kinase RdoA (MazF antagonist)